MALGPQFHEMVKRMDTEGGFSYNPRKARFDTEGYAVAVHPERVHTTTGGTADTMHQYHEKNADLLSTAPNYMGGWRDPEGQDVLDVSKVYPQTGAGHTAARYQAVKHGQTALFNMGAAEEEMNPFRPDSPDFPEFASYVKNRTMSQVQKNLPEVQAWIQGPKRRGE